MGNMAGKLNTISKDPPAPITSTHNALERETVPVTSSFFDTPIQKPSQDCIGLHSNILKKMSDKKKCNDNPLSTHLSVNSKCTKDAKKPNETKSCSKKQTTSAVHPKED